MFTRQQNHKDNFLKNTNMKIRIFSIVAVFFTYVVSLYGGNQPGDSVVVGDLAYLQLLPGSPVKSVVGAYNEDKLDRRGRRINEDEFLVSIDERTLYSPSGEAIIRIEYEYDEESDCGDQFLFWEFSRSYDSKGRLIHMSSGERPDCSFIYDENNLIVSEYYSSEGNDYKAVYDYNEDGHCVYMAIYEAVGYDENARLLLADRPFYQESYEILRIDEYGNWTARRSSSGDVEERKILYYIQL